jgi:chromosomal replication initiation ATPase DnaA
MKRVGGVMVTWAEAETQSKQHFETVLAAVGKRYGFTKEELRGSWRSDRRATRFYAREITVYLTWRLVPMWNICHLARVFAADYVEILHIIRKLEQRQQTNEAFASELAELYLDHFDEMIAPRILAAPFLQA